MAIPIFEKIFKRFYNQDPSKKGEYPSFLDLLFDDSKARERLDSFYSYMTINYDRQSRYRDYEAMDIDVISSALDLFADDSTQFNLVNGHSLTIDSPSLELKEDLEYLLFNVLNIEEHLWSIVRIAAKYGDYFVRVFSKEGEGIKSIDYSYHPARISRVDCGGAIKWYFLDQNKDKLFNPWDWVHFKIPGNAEFPLLLAPGSAEFQFEYDEDDPKYEHKLNFYTYGRSTIESARKVWRQLQLLEDAVLLTRLFKAQKRNVFSVNTTGLSEVAADQLIKHTAQLLKKKRAIAPGTEMLSTSSLFDLDEDVVLPVYGEKGSVAVTEIGGDAEIQHLADLEYARNKLYAALKTPKPFLGYEESLNGRNTVRMLDVRYARTIKNLQRVLIVGLERTCRIHLSLLKKDPFGVPFKIIPNYISTPEEAEKSEILSNKADAVDKLLGAITTVDGELTKVNKEKLVRYILKEYNFSDEDIKDIMTIAEGELEKAAEGAM